MILRISGLPKLNLFRKIFWLFVLKKVDIITTPTIATKNHLKNIFNNSKIYLLRDPIINISEINKKITKLKKDEKINNNYIAVGRLTKQKNFLFLLKCFKIIINKNSNNFLYILGSGEDYGKLHEFIKNNNLDKNIFLEGYQENIYKYLSKAKAFILPSLWEDPGFVLLEASYSNVTLISSDCKNGPIEILDNGRNGFLFKSNKIESFLEIFSNFEKSDLREIKQKKISAKKMSKNFSLFSHFSELNKILINN